MKIGLTLGEPAGIGPEVARKAVELGKFPKGVELTLIGSESGVTPGVLSPQSAKAALKGLEESFARWKSGELDAIVTGPVSKENLSTVGFSYPGQTEFFAARCGIPSSKVVMMMTDRKLTVSLLSTHCSLKKAIKAITPSKLRHVILTTQDHLVHLLAKRPRIAVAGLNPHAGEHGLFGSEEAKIFTPVIERCQSAGMEVSGPHSPDTVFHRAARGEFDAVICAYHDQGLIPFKLLAFATGVNVSLGLPLIRTSPDHGTALDLAGKNQADPRSMIAAIQLAIRMVKVRNNT